MNPTPAYLPPPEPNRSPLLTALVGGAIIALVAANIYLYVQLDHVRTEMARNNEKVMTELSNIRDASSVTSASQMRHIEAMKDELEATRTQARSMSNQAKVEAQAHAEQLAKEIQAEEAKVRLQVNSEISDVQQSSQANAAAAAAANAKIADVSTDVGAVKTNLTQTQSQLDKTIADLKSVRGDLGVQSGLVATNATELAALKLHGERNYIDVKLGRAKTFTRFGDITLKLQKIDPKRNKYTVDVMADDKLTEKKDKNVNEPVQFYTSKGGHIPYELVINSVTKDQIVGYLSTPKEIASR